MYPVCGQKITEISQTKVDALERNPSGRRTIIRNDFTGSSLNATHGGTAVVRPQGVPARTAKRSQKGRIKSSTVAIYASVFILLVSVIAVGYRAPEQSIASAAPIANTAKGSENLAVNDVVATDIAASVAQAADLAIAPNAAQLAVSTRVQSEFRGSGDSSTINKPSILQLTDASRNITSYTVKQGDTVTSVAASFGVSEDTIKWANDLVGNTLAVDSKLDVLPRDGIVYTIKDGDTVEGIATKYKADAAIIVSYNDLELNGVSTGLRIIIPAGVLPEVERPGYVAPRTYSSSSSSSSRSTASYNFRAGSVGNKYAFGNCTWYAYEKRASIGRPVGSFWGNANTWARAAANQGYLVNGTPAAGALLVEESGYYGHVAIVEKILPNGDVFISEMNNYAYGGFNIVSTRTLTPGQAALYKYVH